MKFAHWRNIIIVCSSDDDRYYSYRYTWPHCIPMILIWCPFYDVNYYYDIIVLCIVILLLMIWQWKWRWWWCWQYYYYQWWHWHCYYVVLVLMTIPTDIDERDIDDIIDWYLMIWHLMILMTLLMMCYDNHSSWWWWWWPATWPGKVLFHCGSWWYYYWRVVMWY